MLKNNKGFSLVELMVVVAIIGVLAAIGIPQITKYMARARQAEAKSNLASIYTANKAFFAEYGIYDNRFNVIGYRPEGKLRYNVGWAAAGTRCNLGQSGYTGAVNGGINSVAQCGVGTNPGGAGCIVLASGNLAVDDADEALNCDAAGGSTFMAGAIGRIGSTTTADRWTINQSKNLRQPAGGDGTN